MNVVTLLALGVFGCRGGAGEAPDSAADWGSDLATDSADLDALIGPPERFPPPGGLDPATPEPPEDGLTTTTTRTSRADGTAYLTVDVEPGTTSFLVTAIAGSNTARVRTIYGPDGVPVLSSVDWGGPERVTGAFRDRHVSVVGFPIRQEDGPLEPGPYRVNYQVSGPWGTPASGQVLELTAQTKVDSEPNRGVLHVDLVVANGIGSLLTYRDAIEAAAERWRQEWSPLGVEVVVSTRSADVPRHVSAFTGPSSLAGLSGPLYEALAEDGGDDHITMVVAGQIDGGGGAIGMSGGLPGSLVASVESAVVLAADAFAGVDGAFDADETELLASGMAHEAGHYLGLYHPVELSWLEVDAYSDTPVCASQRDCISTLGSNVMYPSVVCSNATCAAPFDVTPEQLVTVNLYAGTL